MVFGLAMLLRREFRQLAVVGCALLSFLCALAAGSVTNSSPVNKTVVALWHKLTEQRGYQLTQEFPEVGQVTIFFGGLELAPNGTETNYDYVVHQARDMSTWRFVADHAAEIFPEYGASLGQVVTTGARGLREMAGNAMLALFLIQMAISGFRRGETDLAVWAIGLGAWCHYLGPIVLLRGIIPVHYILVVLPFAVLLGARGLAQLTELAGDALARSLPDLAQRVRAANRFVMLLLFCPLLCLATLYYYGTVNKMREFWLSAEEDRAALQELHLEGHKIACRTMVWFIDSDVQTILLPYAKVEDLTKYVHSTETDGILLWRPEEKRHAYLCRSAYPSWDDFRQSLEKSQFFESPRVAGSWHWYPLRKAAFEKREP